MSDLDWVLIQLVVFGFGFIGFVLFLVLAPVVLIAKKINRNRKKRQAETNRLSALGPQSVPPGVAVFAKDGRVIAMEAMEPQTVMPGTPPPQKSGGNMAMNVAKRVAGRAAAAAAKHYLRRWLFGK